MRRGWRLTCRSVAVYRRPMLVSLSRVSALGRAALPLARFSLARATSRKFPLMVTLSITDRCNFRCVYCELPAMNRDEMSTQEWLGAIDELHRAGMMRASIMGGEPLVRPDVRLMIDHLAAKGIHRALDNH